MCRIPEHIQAAISEAAKLNATFTWSISSGNHIEGVVSVRGKSRKVYFAKTPSDCNARWDAKRNVRYALKAIGV